MFSRSARFYDAVYGFKDYAGEAAHLRELIEARRPGARTLLDVACGTGKHLAELRRWYAVEGTDLDPALLDRARERLPGVPLHQADMVDVDLGRTFDVVTSLFSSIGYVRTRERLGRAAQALARHVAPGGILVVEPWLHPEVWEPGRVSAVFVDEPELKIARVNRSERADGTLVIDFHYVVGTPEVVETFVERHELGMFTSDEYLQAFEEAGLEVEHDAEGLIGRGLYIGSRGA